MGKSYQFTNSNHGVPVYIGKELQVDVTIVDVGTGEAGGRVWPRQNASAKCASERASTCIPLPSGSKKNKVGTKK